MDRHHLEQALRDILRLQIAEISRLQYLITGEAISEADQTRFLKEANRRIPRLADQILKLEELETRASELPDGKLRLAKAAKAFIFQQLEEVLPPGTEPIDYFLNFHIEVISKEFISGIPDKKIHARTKLALVDIAQRIFKTSGWKHANEFRDRFIDERKDDFLADMQSLHRRAEPIRSRLVSMRPEGITEADIDFLGDAYEQLAGWFETALRLLIGMYRVSEGEVGLSVADVRKLQFGQLIKHANDKKLPCDLFIGAEPYIRNPEAHRKRYFDRGRRLVLFPDVKGPPRELSHQQYHALVMEFYSSTTALLVWPLIFDAYRMHLYKKVFKQLDDLPLSGPQ